MGSKSISFALLTSVTSAERAAAIEGDLLEEREVNGTRWFVMNVVHTTFALFGLAVARAPFRTAALSVAAVLASCLMCPIVNAAFFGPEAWVPRPLLGFVAVIAFAVVIGASLVHFAGALGVRAAVAASALLFLMFAFAQVSGRLDRLSTDAVGLLREFATFAVNLGLGFCLYLGPLMIASGVVHMRRL